MMMFYALLAVSWTWVAVGMSLVIGCLVGWLSPPRATRRGAEV